MLAKFFVDRPIFAWVISVVITLGGLVAAFTLPVAQYPDISPPTIQVAATYPGASAQTLADTVAAPVEQQVNGVEGMMYLASTCANDGTYNLTVTFDLGTDINLALMLVQARVQLALPQLPEQVQRQGLKIDKKSPNILMMINLYSPNRTRDQLYMSNYVTIQINDEIARLKGVGATGVLGEQQYSMRAWLDPDKLAYHGLSAADVVAAVREQNVQVASGQVGQEPVPKGQTFQLTLSTLGRLESPGQFEDIVVKTGQPGDDGVIRAAVRLKDVVREPRVVKEGGADRVEPGIELGAQNQDVRNTLDGNPSVGLAVYTLPGSNALEVADRVDAKMRELRTRFPTDLEYAVRYDTSPFITQSIEEVFSTLRDAIILVAIVVLFFLQDWRAMILPMIDVPVALTGTFGVMYLLGFSMNNLTLFGLVLAIGIVVDDAIVVLENIERWIAMGHDARTATIGAMEEITGPIVAITLVLSSVFLPSAFLPGISGQFFRQFALTIASAMVISAINAMTMTPARAVSIFKGQERRPGEGHDPHAGKEALPWWGTTALFGLLNVWLLTMQLGTRVGIVVVEGGNPPSAEKLWGYRAAFFLPGVVVGFFLAAWVNRVLALVFRAFNKSFDVATKVYGRSVAVLLRLSLLVLAVYGGLLFLTYRWVTTTPVGFIPMQDKGYLIVNVQLPDAASVQRTSAVMAQIDDIVLGPVIDQKTGQRDRSKGWPGCASSVGIAGQSVILNTNAPNFGTMFIVLDDFDKRVDDPKKNGFQIFFDLNDALDRKVRDAEVAVFPPPPVDGLGMAGGFKVMIEDRGDMGPLALQAATQALTKELKADPRVTEAFSMDRANAPQLYVDIDRVKCRQLGVALKDVFDTLQVYVGGTYVNQFTRFGRTWQVNVQADADFRKSADYIRNLKVKNDKNEMVPLGSVARVEDSTGPLFVQRYNMYRSTAINGGLAPGVSTGDGMKLMEEAAAKTLPKQAVYQWTELFYLQTMEGDSAVYAFLGAVLLVYLVLAAKYESWTLPLAIILVVPMCVLSALAGIRAAELDMDIFVQVGFIVLVGLAAKNAILVVEFADQQRTAGLPLREAVLKSVELRLRPIVMTSFAFILGVVPLVLAEGAGSEMRIILGLAVLCGMIGVTFFGIFLTPVFAYVIGKLKKDPPKGEVK